MFRIVDITNGTLAIASQRSTVFCLRKLTREMLQNHDFATLFVQTSKVFSIFRWRCDTSCHRDNNVIAIIGKLAWNVFLRFAMPTTYAFFLC